MHLNTQENSYWNLYQIIYAYTNLFCNFYFQNFLNFNLVTCVHGVPLRKLGMISNKVWY